ncbi:MAG: hypothetical protein AAF889_03250 [Cyanobacteria bacterium P01_D01_bin.73]
MTNSAQPSSQKPTHTVTPFIVPEQMFALIDNLLPFEVCLYHQVLPLSIRESTLFLGAVHPDESEGLKYVQALLAHTPYTIALKPIAAATQQHYLSAFLSYDRQIKEAGEDLIEHSAEMALADDSTYAGFLDDSEASTIPDGRRFDSMGQKETVIAAAAEDTDGAELDATVVAPASDAETAAPAGSGVDSADASDSDLDEESDLPPTVGVDLAAIASKNSLENELEDELEDDSLEAADDPANAIAMNSEQLEAQMDTVIAPTNVAAEELIPHHSGALQDVPRQIPPSDREDEAKAAADANEEEDPGSFAEEFEAALAAEDVPPGAYVVGDRVVQLPTEAPVNTTSSSIGLPPPKPTPAKLVFDQVDENLSPEELGELPPRALTQALLRRSIVQGIGRLFLERHENHGRILCSQDGVLEAVLDPIPIPSFQGVINELKLLAEAPLIQAERSKQIDMERIHKEELLLLRLRLSPGSHGEEATLQVLRGAALKFYQQQQLSKLGQNALSLARRLQQEVAEIEARSRLLTEIGTDSFPSVPELRQLVRYISTTLDHF